MYIFRKFLLQLTATLSVVMMCEPLVTHASEGNVAGYNLNGIATEADGLIGSFSGGLVISGFSVSVTGNTSSGFSEPGEPIHAGNAGGRSIWYRWTAPEDGTLFLDTIGSQINTLLGLYVGTTLQNLIEISSNDDAYKGSKISALTAEVQGGVTYHIAVDGFYDSVTNTIQKGAIRLNLDWRPTNNDFANATVITGSKNTYISFVNNADFELAEPYHLGFQPSHSVWWRYSPSESGIVLVDTYGSDFETVLAVYQGSAMSYLTPVLNESKDSSGQFVFQSLAGNEYYFAVDAPNLEPDQGKVLLNFTTVTTSGADFFASCGLLEGFSDSSSATNQAATRESGEPMHAGRLGGKSVWWCWTAPSNSNVRISTAGSTISTLVGVYIGSNIKSLIEVPSTNDPERQDPTKITFKANAGTTYRIAVESAVENGILGSGVIFIQLGLIPDNDKFSNRFFLGNDKSIFALGNNVKSTFETGEPNHGALTGGKSVWWSWKPSVKGMVTIDTRGSNFDTALVVYRGSTLQTLTEIGGNNNADENLTYSRLEFLAIPGRTYQIAVDGIKGETGDIVLNIDQVLLDEVRLVNLSTRGWVGVDQQTMIAGFVITGNPGEWSRVIIRALGNSLVSGGLNPSVVVPDPDLTLVKSNNVVVASNKQWVNGTSPTLVAQYGLAPIDPNEAVIIADLLPGAYTANVVDALGRTGIGLVEVYYVSDENSGGVSSRLVNISTRAFIGTGDQRVIGGFVVSGNKPKTVLIRGLGTSLGTKGVSNALTNPLVELYSGPNKINSNDDWQSASNASAIGSLFPPEDSKESALLVTLDPGAYTAILSGVGGATGIGLIEIYEAD
jgi:hypothetical protein